MLLVESMHSTWKDCGEIKSFQLHAIQTSRLQRFIFQPKAEEVCIAAAPRTFELTSIDICPLPIIWFTAVYTASLFLVQNFLGCVKCGGNSGNFIQTLWRNQKRRRKDFMAGWVCQDFDIVKQGQLERVDTAFSDSEQTTFCQLLALVPLYARHASIVSFADFPSRVTTG